MRYRLNNAFQLPTSSFTSCHRSGRHGEIRADERLIARPNLDQELTWLNDPGLLDSPDGKLLGEYRNGDLLRFTPAVNGRNSQKLVISARTTLTLETPWKSRRVLGWAWQLN